MDLSEVHAEIVSFRGAVVSVLSDLGRQIALLADQQARSAQMMDERISGFEGRIEGRMSSLELRLSMVERQVSQFDVRLTKMLSDQVRARTEDLERWMQHEDRLRRLES